MQSEEVILAWVPDHFLIQRKRDLFTISQMGRWPWSLQGLLDHS
jgi:hypothetical protein